MVCTTYTSAENDIIIQAEHIIDVPKNIDTIWSAKSYTLKGTFRALSAKTATFTTDINAEYGAAWIVGNEHAIVDAPHLERVVGRRRDRPYRVGQWVGHERANPLVDEPRRAQW